MVYCAYRLDDRNIPKPIIRVQDRLPKTNHHPKLFHPHSTKKKIFSETMENCSIFILPTIIPRYFLLSRFAGFSYLSADTPVCCVTHSKIQSKMDKK